MQHTAYFTIVLQSIILNIHKYNIVKAIMLLLYLLTFSKSTDIVINVNVQFSQQRR